MHEKFGNIIYFIFNHHFVVRIGRVLVSSLLISSIMLIYKDQVGDRFLFLFSSMKDAGKVDD